MVELTEWERTKLSQHAAATSLTYMGHHARGGLFQHEIEEMERWQALSEKLELAEPATPTLGGGHVDADVFKALKLAEGRLALLIQQYPDPSENCDHPVATQYVLDKIRAAITTSGTYPSSPETQGDDA